MFHVPGEGGIRYYKIFSKASLWISCRLIKVGINNIMVLNNVISCLYHHFLLNALLYLLLPNIPCTTLHIFRCTTKFEPGSLHERWKNLLNGGAWKQKRDAHNTTQPDWGQRPRMLTNCFEGRTLLLFSRIPIYVACSISLNAYTLKVAIQIKIILAPWAAQGWNSTAINECLQKNNLIEANFYKPF